MELEADIIDRVHADFGSADAPTVLAELEASGRKGRLARCIVLAAGGSLELLRELIHMPDYRDVIMAGEYDDVGQHIRDLSASFLVDLPDDAWVCQVADVAAKHGYRLTKLESRAAELGSFEYSSDRGEGEAAFSNGLSTVVIRKADRRWSISSGGVNLHRFGLDNSLGTEEQFCNQLDYYLSPLGVARASEMNVGLVRHEDTPPRLVRGLHNTLNEP